METQTYQFSQGELEDEHNEMMERLQAADTVDKLETEINDCECAAQIHKCPICWDKMTLINEINDRYGK